MATVPTKPSSHKQTAQKYKAELTRTSKLHWIHFEGVLRRFRSGFFLMMMLCGPMLWSQIGPGTGTTTADVNAQNVNNLCRIFFTVPKQGAAAQYEGGRKKHNQFHATQKDTFTWNTWLIETGDNAGRYVTSTCGHQWKDFDEWEKRMGDADTKDGNVNLQPFSQGGHNGFYVYRSDMSLAPAGQPPAPMVSATIYVLHPGATNDFIGAIKRINEALSKQPNWPKTSGWLQLVNGGEGPTFVLLSQRQNWSDFAPQPKPAADVLNDTYGKEQSDAIMKIIRDSTAHLYTEAATYRPDLSYKPSK
jgi:hypothetical protein